MIESKKDGLTHRQVVEAVSDGKVRGIVGLAVRRESAILEPNEFDDLKTALAEHGVIGKDLPRIVYMCAADIKRVKKIKRSID